MTVRLEVCHSCREKAVVALLDCGPQPVGHRFLTSAGQEEGLFPLVVSQCRACGLIQLSHPAPVDEIRPRFDWISYNEPDAHLDALVEALSKLPGLLRESHVGAVVVGGDKTIECFQQRGFANIWRIDLQRDLDVCEPNSGTETLQARLTPEAAARITHEQGLFDLLVVRHMVEHAHEARSFLAAIQQMLKPGGYAIFEVPDCSRAFDACDYSILWEEHVFYFMPFHFPALPGNGRVSGAGPAAADLLARGPDTQRVRPGAKTACGYPERPKLTVCSIFPSLCPG